MKKKKILIISLLLCVFTLTGCTSYLKDEDKKIVKNDSTGQNLPENILCQPISLDTISKYEKYNKDFSSLPKCDEFKINSGGYEGIWTTIFVKPLAWLILRIGYFIKVI
jgi:hypothetical protein